MKAQLMLIFFVCVLKEYISGLSPREKNRLQKKIDLLVKEIIGLKSSIHSIAGNVNGLVSNIHSVTGNIRSLKSNVRSNTLNVKGLEDHERSDIADFKGLHIRVHSNEEAIKDLHTSLASIRTGIAVSRGSTVSYPTSTIEWQKQQLIGEPTHISKGNLITTLDTMEKQYKVSFDFNGPKMGHYGNIIHLTIKGDDNTKYGDWIPCVYYNGGMLEISSAVNGESYFYKTAVITPNTWHSIEVAQEREGKTYFYSITVDGEIITRIINFKAAIFHDVKVYASDPWYAPQTGYIRNFYYQHKVKKVNSAKTYYAEYKALFVGFGYSASSSNEQKLSIQHSLEECLLVCYSKHETGNKWNGVRYATLSKDCYCIQNSQGHTDSKTDLHYKFLN